MAEIYRDEDVDTRILNGRKIGIVGYGNQGRAQALNIRDSGFEIACYIARLLRSGRSLGCCG